LKLHRDCGFGEVSIAPLQPHSARKSADFPKLARRLQLITLPLVWQPFPLAALAEAARATVPTGKAMH
jgi:hypothetical protein